MATLPTLSLDHQENGPPWILRRLERICDVVVGAAADESLLVQLCAAICHYSDWTICAILSVERETGINRLIARYDPFENTPRETNWQLRGSPVQQVLATGIPFVLQDVDRNETYKAFADDARRRGYTTLAIAPLVLASDEPVHYCLSLKRIDRAEVTESELIFIRSLSRVVATVVCRATAFETVRHSLRDAEAARKLQADLCAIAARERDLAGLAVRLADLPLPPMVLHEFIGQRSLPTEPDVDSDPDFADALWRRLADLRMGEIELTIPGEYVALPLLVTDILSGALILRRRDRKNFSDSVLTVLRDTCAVILEREQTQFKTRQELCQVLLRRALEDFQGSGPLIDDIRRLFDLDLRQHIRLAAIRPADDSFTPEQLMQNVLAGLRTRSLPPAVARLGDTLWIALRGDARSGRALHNIVNDLTTLPGNAVLIAISEASNVGLSIPSAMMRCQRLLAYAGPRGLRGEISHVGVADSALLLATLGGESTENFVGSVLASLSDNPSDHMTLQVFLDANGNLARTAERLGIHVTTLRYRLEKIRERGIDLDHPESRFALSLALRLRALQSEIK